MEEQNRITIFLKRFFLISICIIGIGFLAIQIIWQDGYSYRKANVSTYAENAKLILADGTEVALKTENDKFLYKDASKNEILTVSMRLPDSLDEDLCIGMFSAEQNISIYIDESLRECYDDTASRIMGSYSVNHLLLVPLSAADSGKELRITYQTALRASVGILPCPKIGTEADFFLWVFQRYFWQFMSAILLFLFGFVFIIFGLVIKYNGNNNVGLCYLGIFSIMVAIWLVCQSELRIFYGMNLNATDILASLSMMLVPIPKMMFLNELMKYRYQKVYNIVIAVALVNATISMLLAMFGVVDLIEIRLTTHAVIIGTGIVCICCFLLYARTHKFAAPKAITIGVSGLVVAVGSEYLSYFISKDYYAGKFIGYGILFFLLMLGYATEKNWILQWQEYKKTLERNKIKNTFLANMSHEIKTPINTIMGMNEMILRESDDYEITHYADHIRDAGQMLLSLVNNILDYTMIESGNMQIMPTRYDMGQMLSNLVHYVNSKISERNICFDMDVDEKIPSILYGDELRIRQVVINLLSNALKYTEEGKISLLVRAESLDERNINLCISVKDSGIGIQEHDRERMFDSFVRLDEKKNRSIEGAGLGMTIIRQIMDLMQGKIDIESEYGKGSVFTVSFAQEVLDKQPIGRYEDWYRTSKKENQDNSYQVKDAKILVVDDNEMNLEVIKGLLKKTGAFVDEAICGEDGIEKVKQKEYDIILLDHMMPGLDGFETLKRMRQIETIQQAKTPIVALTANSIMGAKEEYLKKGFTDYIPKPVSYKSLMTILKKYLPDKIKKYSQTQKKQSLFEDYLEQRGIHMKSALKYAGDEFEQYVHLIKMLTSQKNEERMLALKEAYETQNWKDYTIYVHGLKNMARTVGAEKLADMAYEHEIRGKACDSVFIRNDYPNLVQEWENTGEIIQACLALYTEQKEEKKTERIVNEKTTAKIEDLMKKAISFLEEYKKKDALKLLEEVVEMLSEEEKKHKLELAIGAVREYEYEHAMQLLRDIAK